MLNKKEIQKIIKNYDYNGLFDPSRPIEQMWKKIQELNELVKQVGGRTLTKREFIKLVEKKKKEQK